ncbi:hypothetical protein ACFYXC_38585 [Streptomyces sp. NPDC002701]|uniref:hypothetical protein n=1 Tax=Streptomyces sp. NPDC002701 TaxID=3364661 RepID=UPI0036B3BB76
MADADPVPITDENAAAHAIAAAIHEIVKQRLIRAGSVVRASVAYSNARKTGKTERGAVRDAAIELVRQYRFQHNL